MTTESSSIFPQVANKETAEVIGHGIRYWPLASRLESGRAEVLRQVAQGGSLADVLNLLCEKAEKVNITKKLLSGFAS